MANLTGTQELEIRKLIAQQIDALDTELFVVPSPILFSDRADFFNVINPLIGQKTIEQTLINAVFISFERFEDNPDAGCGLENPEITLFYRLHLFVEYGFSRVDESDSFLTRVLSRERDFMNFLLKIRENFLGENPLAGLPAEIESAVTVNITNDDFAEERAPTDFIAGAEGFQTDLTLPVRVFMREETV